ncbi:hypothetical protein J3F83DRAFT_751749 [Trichoderma novae-zelandiae]
MDVSSISLIHSSSFQPICLSLSFLLLPTLCTTYLPSFPSASLFVPRREAFRSRQLLSSAASSSSSSNFNLSPNQSFLVSSSVSSPSPSSPSSSPRITSSPVTPAERASLLLLRHPHHQQIHPSAMHQHHHQLPRCPASMPLVGLGRIA